MLKNALILFLIGFFPVCQSQTIISEAVKKNIQARVDNEINMGIVVGVIDSQGPQFYSYGVKSEATKEAVNEHSVFEIGSISKTFTGIILADMVVKEELKLSDPLQKHLPKGVTAPTRNGASIKLVHMANHTSSLPRMPDNFAPANSANPYADYSEKQLYDFLTGYELTRDIGTEFEYSNYAMGLLGHILATKREMTYEELVVEVIAKPLGLKDTRTAFTPNMKKNLAMGHSRGVQVGNWDLSSFAGAGALRSTAVDMLKYLAANMGKVKSTLYPAMQLTHQRTTKENNSYPIGLAWDITSTDSLELISHGGVTGGYRAFAGFISGGDKGVVVLTNSNASINDIGMHLLNPASPLKDR